MSPRVYPSLVEVYLLVEQPRQRLSYWSQALVPLDGHDAPTPTSVDAYYEAATNQAIFVLRYDARALGDDRLARVAEIATLCEATLIHADELSAGERKRFVSERLARCNEQVSQQRAVVPALVELVRRVRQKKASLTQPPPVVSARGTRGSQEPPRPQGTRDLARGSVRQPKLEREEHEGDAVPEEVKRVVSEPMAAPIPVLIPKSGPISGPVTTIDPPHGMIRGLLEPEFRGADYHADVESSAARPAPLPPPPSRPPPVPRPRAQSPKLSPNVVSRGGVHRANTVMMSPGETQRMLEAANATQRVPVVSSQSMLPDPILGDEADDQTREMLQAQGERSPIAHSSESPYAEVPLGEAAEPGAIYARYLRSGRWVPIRIGALSLRGATLMAGALPRLDDRVDISLLFGNFRALVRGTVGKLSTREEAAASGAATFNVTFDLDEASRRQLTFLLTAARAAKVTLKPPPPRATQRFPVEWPVALGTPRGAVRAEALDVSTDGMFVKPVHALTLDANVTFTSVLDDALPPVSGHARIVRSINDVEARTAGLSPGYGINILDMSGSDRMRWDAFLARVEKRTARRVLVGASPARLAELQAGLVAAGYTATGGSDPGAIAQLATADNHSVDAALIDAGWLAASGSPSWVEALFSSRNVPCVTMHGDARRARMAIDRLLSVS